MYARNWIALGIIATVGFTGCGGGVFFITHGSGGTNVLFVSGICSTVQLMTIVGPGGNLIVVTAVTLISNGGASTTNFCGNVVDQFPLNSSLNVQFTNHAGCATATSIAVR